MDAHKCAINFRLARPVPSGAAPGSRRRPGGAASKPPSDLRIMVSRRRLGFCARAEAGYPRCRTHEMGEAPCDPSPQRSSPPPRGSHWLRRRPAQDYPARPIRIIIPLGPGGGGDVFTRALADELQKALGQPVVVDNRPGGGLNIGARACAESSPDGYTICVMSSEPVIYNQFLFRSLPYDPEKDFEPIAILFVNTLALVVNSALKVRTIPDLVALSRAKPGTLSYGTFAFRARAVHGEAQEGDRRRRRAGAVPQRQRAAQRGAVGIDPDRAAGALQHGPAAAERPRHRARDREQDAFAAVSRYPDLRGGSRARTIRRPGSACSRRPAPRRRSWRSSPARSPASSSATTSASACSSTAASSRVACGSMNSRASSARTASPPSGSSRSWAGNRSENSHPLVIRLMWRSRRAF